MRWVFHRESIFHRVQPSRWIRYKKGVTDTRWSYNPPNFLTQAIDKRNVRWLLGCLFAVNSLWAHVAPFHLSSDGFLNKPLRVPILRHHRLIRFISSFKSASSLETVNGSIYQACNHSRLNRVWETWTVYSDWCVSLSDTPLCSVCHLCSWWSAHP